MSVSFCNSNKTLTKDIVFQKIKPLRKEWEASHDTWDGSVERYKNAPNGFDANVIGAEYAELEKGQFKCVVTHLEKDESGEYNSIGSRVIFSFIIEGDKTSYVADENRKIGVRL